MNPTHLTRLILLALPLIGFACEPAEEPSLGEQSPVTPAPNTNANQPSPNGDQATGTGDRDNTQNHMEDPSAGSNPNQTNTEQKKQDEAAIGSTNIVARLHTCGKVGYGALGTFLASRGVNLQGNGAGKLWREGNLALGVANYDARVAEAAFPSTAAFSKMFDIFTVAASEIRQNLASSTACPGVAATGEDGRLTKDAVSCLIGAPASAELVDLANIMFSDPQYADRPEDAAELGITALLTSHQLCE